MNNEELIEILSNINKTSCPSPINFHCHTTFSDGSLKPDKLLEEAYKNKIKFISITDHHTINAYKYIQNNKYLDKYPRDSIKLITGIEINCLLKGCLVHVIGLGIDINSKYLRPYIKGESPIGEYLKAHIVAKAIREAGGISFLAHPGRYRIPFNILIPEAFNNEINGIEVWYDYSLSKFWKPSSFICEEIEKITDKYGMFKSCGTDSHGFSLLGR